MVHTWHTEVMYNLIGSRSIHFWVSIIVDGTKALGTLEVLEGSHHKRF